MIYRRFVFHLPERLSEGVEIDVFYELGAASPWNSRKSQRKQYLQRLSVELIKASQKLFGQDQPSSTDSTPSPDKKVL